MYLQIIFRFCFWNIFKTYLKIWLEHDHLIEIFSHIDAFFLSRFDWLVRPEV